MDSSPKTSEWTSFTRTSGHIKKWRTVGENLEIKEQIAYSQDQHATIVHAEYLKAKREFSIPDNFTKNKNPILSHTVQVKQFQGIYFIYIDTVMKVKYITISGTFKTNHRHIID